MRSTLRRRPPTPEPGIAGSARVDRRTKSLTKRLRAGEIAVIDHEDLDTVATESLLSAGIVAVVNAAACISGRYPNSGPLLLPVAGVDVLDGVGSEIMDLVEDGQEVTIDGDRLLVSGQEVARGVRQDLASFGEVLEVSRLNMGDELQRFDRACAEFERSVASRQSPLQNAVTLIKAAVTLPP